MRVSVVTPCLNPGERFVRCLDSVSAQTYEDVEHVIVDGGSTDGTVELARSRGLRVVSEPDRGQTDALNKGFALATGDYLGWLERRRLARPRGARTNRRDVQGEPRGGLGLLRLRDSAGERHRGVVRAPARLDKTSIDFGNRLTQPGVFVARWALDRVGPLDEEIHLAMDFDLWLRLLDADVPAAYIPEPLAVFEIHGPRRPEPSTCRSSTERSRSRSSRAAVDCGGGRTRQGGRRGGAGRRGPCRFRAASGDDRALREHGDRVGAGAGTTSRAAGGVRGGGASQTSGHPARVPASRATGSLVVRNFAADDSRRGRQGADRCRPPSGEGVEATHVGLNLVYLVPGETGGMEIYARELIPALLDAGRPAAHGASSTARPRRRRGPWARAHAERVTVPVRARRRVGVGARRAAAAAAARRARRRRPRAQPRQHRAAAGGTFRRVVTIHDLIYRLLPEAHFGLRAIGMRVLVPLAARRSHRIIADSQSTRDDLDRAARGPRRRRSTSCRSGIVPRPPPQPLPRASSAPGSTLGDRPRRAHVVGQAAAQEPLPRCSTPWL